MASLRIDGKSNQTYTGKTISNPTGYGVEIIRSTSIKIADSRVEKCLLGGIREYGNSGNYLIRVTVTGNGKDSQPYNGDGILVQGRRTIVDSCIIEDNGNDPTFEHGIYAAHVAREYILRKNVLNRNAASGIKASGGGQVTGNTVMGSVRGIVFADNEPVQVTVKGNRIGATLYAILVTSNCRLERYVSDENTFLPNSRFGYKGQSLDLAGWRKQTGLDKHSVYGTW